MADSKMDGENCCKPSTSNYSKELLLLFNNDEDAIIRYEQRKRTVIGQDITDYKIGDIVWAKIWTYPFWPAIICVDPIEKTYIKGHYNDFLLYVRFFNDDSRGSWSKNIEPYCSVEEQLDKYPNLLGTLSLHKKRKKKWDGAVSEANDWACIDKEYRMSKFASFYGLDYSSTFIFDESLNDNAKAENVETSTGMSITKPKTAKKKEPEPEKIKLDLHHSLKESTKEPVVESTYLCRKISKDTLNLRIMRLNITKLCTNDEKSKSNNKSSENVTPAPDYPTCGLSTSIKIKEKEKLEETIEEKEPIKLLDEKDNPKSEH